MVSEEKIDNKESLAGEVQKKEKKLKESIYDKRFAIYLEAF